MDMQEKKTLRTYQQIYIYINKFCNIYKYT